MPSRCLDIASISRYLYHLAELEDVLHVEGHVGCCARCRDKLQRMKHYTETLFDEHDAGMDRQSTCPSLIALEHFRRDALQERQMIRIQSHVQDCAACHDWVRQRQPAVTAWEVPGLCVPWTRTPDLDLRVARQGVRVALGAEWLGLDGFATLFQRLDLPDPGPITPTVMIHRSVHFRRPGLESTLRGRVDFLGYEGFRLTLSVTYPMPLQRLYLWTRSRVHERWHLRGGTGEVSCLLMPGHYFVGFTPEEEPLVALSVEPELLSPRALAACGYEACRAGRFARALACFEQASRLAPQRGYGLMHRRTLSLARRFHLASRDTDITWDAHDRSGTRGAAAPAVLLGRGAEDAEAVVSLVEALRRQSNVQAPRATLGSVAVSRRRFLPAFADLMEQHWRALQQQAVYVESPIPSS